MPASTLDGTDGSDGNGSDRGASSRQQRDNGQKTSVRVLALQGEERNCQCQRECDWSLWIRCEASRDEFVTRPRPANVIRLEFHARIPSVELIAGIRN